MILGWVGDSLLSPVRGSKDLAEQIKSIGQEKKIL